MLYFTIAFITIAFLIALILFNERRYYTFVEKNSMAVKKIIELNQRFSFYPEKNFNQSYTYDNQKFFSTISCSDYLIYQLQYISGTVYNQIENIKSNKNKYRAYLNEFNLLQFGEFNTPTRKLNFKKLLKTEKKITYSKVITKPVLTFNIKITLFCSKINGRIYDYKTQIFTEDQVVSFIKRLKNKSGTFYNDREIWNALCRVERGKVSNKIRFAIYKRDGYRCRRCGAFGQFVNLEIDHIFPISKGGKTKYDNLQTLCHNCNYEKSDSIF